MRANVLFSRADVLPFVYIDPTRSLGIQPFGFFVVLAMIVGEPLMAWRARRVGLDDKEMRALYWWGLLFAIVSSHVLDVVFYHPQELLRRPALLFRLWEGLSSMGGFLGTVVGAVFWSRFRWRGVRRFPPVERRGERIAILPYSEVVLATFPIAWTIARVGCAVVHDHPGARTSASTLFSVAYPTGAATDVLQHVFGPVSLVWGTDFRHDLGLLEAIFSAALALGVALTWKRRPIVGFYGALVPLAYAPARFALDFLRAGTEMPQGDLRFGSLTFAQWCCFVLVAVGVVMLAIYRRARR